VPLPTPDRIGVIVVDHGSRRTESNDMLLDVVQMFQQRSGYAVVEPAHMELAEPSIQTAFDRCVARGAEMVVLHPYFLLPGKHWSRDIPDLARQAASRHPGVPFLVTAPLGLHPLMAEIMQQRIARCLERSQGHAEVCEVCQFADACAVQTADHHSTKDNLSARNSNS
jgi:sirohydrochlorin ferrochelatase